MSAATYHAPVMLDEVLRHLSPERGGRFVDGTVGGGGHAEAILERGPDATLVGFDLDPEALAETAARLARFGARRFELVRANYSVRPEDVELAPDTLNGAFLDLGISSHQIDSDERGFTFRPGAPLDMRMSGGVDDAATAADLIADRSERELANLFRDYGEERRSGRLARVIVEMRADAPVDSSDRLREAIHRALGPAVTPQDFARLFQALRIVVNDELESLRTALPRFRDLLRTDGVLVVLAYHSLEDRIVKNCFREWSRACICPPALPECRCRGVPLGMTLTRRPMRPGTAEVSRNARARSARLRAWRRA